MCKHMTQFALYLSLITLTLTACATKASGQNYRLSKNGYATVLSAPHSKLSKKQREELEGRQYRSSFKIPMEYYQLEGEVKQLAATLMEKEPDNFTEFRYVWEPEFKHLFSFKREPEKTLAQYTANPHFKSGKQRHFKSYLQAKHKEIFEALGPIEALNGSQINMMKGVVEIKPGYYEDEFFLLPGAEKYRNDPDIKFTFLKRRPTDQVIDPRISPHIRLFLRDNTDFDMVVIGSTSGTIQLRDGCFFYQEEKSLILFPQSSNLGLDEDGYIILDNGRGFVARVGEKMVFYNGSRSVKDAKYTKPL